jgi:beta-phosphoglucomutase-like phosphatase (HAD superfamily)
MSKIVRGVILDMDGTLVDTNRAHAQTWVDALKESGYRVKFDVVLPLMGLGGDKIVPRLTGYRVDSDLGKNISRLRSQLFEQQYLPSVQPFPKVRELLATRSPRRTDRSGANRGHYRWCDQCERRRRIQTGSRCDRSSACQA